MLSVLVFSIFAFNTAAGNFPDHGQGEIAGLVTTNSVILQSRLTIGSDLINNDLPGCEGFGRFEIATSPEFTDSSMTDWIEAKALYDHIIKKKISSLKPATVYYYRLVYGTDRDNYKKGPTRSFKTLGGSSHISRTKFAVVTGMNYFYFHEGKYKQDTGYQGADKKLGYPALETILNMKPDFFIGTGDNVYFDHPAAGRNRYTGNIWTDRAKTEAEMRRKYHEQFAQQRFIDLFANTPTYWQVDDHDYRFNDCDNTGDKEPLPALGRKNFREQLPIVDPEDPEAVTYGTYRPSRDLQIWIVEGRAYRSGNKMPDGPNKSIWGEKQKKWLTETIIASDATFKLLISPTPMIGPDDARKIDNHTNIGGFRHERDAFFAELKENAISPDEFFIICGDRHWQYHSIWPQGLEEFSCGALTDQNARIGVSPGTEGSTDPNGRITQPYSMQKASGGFLLVTVLGKEKPKPASIKFEYFNTKGKLLYKYTKLEK